MEDMNTGIECKVMKTTEDKITKKELFFSPLCLVEVELGHEEAVTRSLDSAVNLTLQGLHKFTRNRPVNHETPTVTQPTTEETSKGIMLWQAVCLDIVNQS